jgi:molybdopterin-guanine dinucleotide biosynthesis protein A
MAVDTPFFPHDFIERAQGLIEGHDAVLGAFAGQDYPTNALWRFEAVRGLPTGVGRENAPHSLKRLAEGLASTRLDYAGIAAEDPFANANTAEDIEKLRARAGGK